MFIKESIFLKIWTLYKQNVSITHEIVVFIAEGSCTEDRREAPDEVHECGLNL